MFDKKGILLVWITSCTFSMEKVTLHEPLLHQNSESQPCSRNSSEEDLFAALTGKEGVHEEFQESHWQERLQDIQDRQFSNDGRVSAGKLIPEFVKIIKQESEQELSQQYLRTITLESTKEIIKKCRYGFDYERPTKNRLQGTPYQPIIDIIRIIQRRNNNFPPYTDFCTSSKIRNFWLSQQGDQLTIATEDNWLQIWSLNQRGSKPTWGSTKILKDPIKHTKVRSCCQKIVESTLSIFFPSRNF